MKTLGLHRIVASLSLAFALVIGAPAAVAQDATATEQLESVDPAEAADVADPDAVSAGSDAYTPMAPTEGKGMPVAGGIDIQPQYSETGEYAYGLHIWLFWVMVVISLFVLALLLYVVFRFRKSANPVPSKTSHNTTIEIIWTVVPALILLAIAVPSITLISKQYKTPPADAITIKAIGYQWYWGYAYPDNGDFEIVSNMLTEEEADARGEPHQLAVDNRMVVPAGVPIRLQVTAADVIHSFAVPSLWFKMDAVPGRLNERIFQVDEPGVYYGQCSELCGARHGYMPIAVEALPMDQYNAWVLAQGGTVAGADEAGVEADPSLPPLQGPESSAPGAPGAGAPPVETPAA
ncbi:cytochrome c oxidase subunit II [Qipengyuania aquimaris]|uniref:Cytochrome c oxidase subunit 2 n=1 Tax=Qipengyuania aquimaris TaxID=255984 RepID=A0A9Q3XDW5_9SPHN|nr:cytochrome c oxidase subunit II [Qipengyuania aquimaris]MBY6128207.1 cytochrome c oxidase subunit II [Qipengyuania aquimaris]MBY6218275.1 cytochrome c oxidase subunit II [Qipengyuania aquimaris]UOR15361.1 cytochrome c oxidase subunit II [Qipengyuania aquimaris]